MHGRLFAHGVEHCCRSPGSTIHQLHRRSFFGWLFGPKADSAAAAPRKGGAGLPVPEEAQRLEVVRLPKFLSEEEITQILLVASEIRRDGAGAVRLQSSPSMSADGSLPSWDQEGYETDRGEWSTSYLQTEYMFQNRLPDLHERAKTAAVEVDREHWGICQAALAAGEPGDKLNTRCVHDCARFHPWIKICCISPAVSR